MLGSRAAGRFTALIALFLFALSAPGPTSLAAQQGGADQRSALERSHPDLANLLDAFDSAHGLLYSAILSADGAADGAAAGSADRRVYERLVRDVLADPDGSRSVQTEGAGSAEGESTAAVPTQVREALDRANTFHRDLLDLYAHADGMAAYRQVGDLVREYQADPETSFLSDPKDMTLVTEGAEAGAFREAFPHLHGLMWAHRWLQLAAFEPLIRYQTPERRRAGITAVVARFWSMLEDPPESFPSEMPMAPTITPALVAYHTEAAAILDNAFMFHDRIADMLVSRNREERSEGLRTALAQFQDPEYRTSSWYDWNRMAILHGVGNQGGWAIDIIPDPTRIQVHLNHEGHDTGHMVMPGMPLR